MNLNKEQIYEWLQEVKDPEIPVLSLVDLGVITQIDLSNNGVSVEMTPTFVGCPAMDYMKQEVESALVAKGIKPVTVSVNYKKTWSSDLITEKGRIALEKFGLAPPPSAQVFTDIGILENAICPRCHETNTELRSPFGPTLCRSIYYCNTCQEAFEQFKPI
ncbi:MAG: phenylacetate-CoA oxygenase subunit PaaJ [Bacteroidetes bacterium]|nr:phenylacetate-CoA oxygenase subunit PaaJ [Bacteroidota bacterium]